MCHPEGFEKARRDCIPPARPGTRSRVNRAILGYLTKQRVGRFIWTVNDRGSGRHRNQVRQYTRDDRWQCALPRIVMRAMILREPTRDREAACEPENWCHVDRNVRIQAGNRGERSSAPENRLMRVCGSIDY